MAIKSDRWIKRMAREHGMIEPFEERQVRAGVVSYGLSSYGYDIRVADEFKVFTNINNTLIDPKNFDPRSFVDIKADTCIVPPNSFALARTIEYFRIPRDVLTVCLGKVHLRPLRHHRQRDAVRARVGRDRDARDLEHDAASREDLRERRHRAGAVLPERRAVRGLVRRQEGEVSEAAGSHVAKDLVESSVVSDASRRQSRATATARAESTRASSASSTAGSASSAGMAIARSTAAAESVATGLISAVNAPRRRASWTRPAAGYTRDDVPIDRKTSQAVADRARCRTRVVDRLAEPDHSRSRQRRALRTSWGNFGQGSAAIFPGSVAARSGATELPDRAVEAQDACPELFVQAVDVLRDQREVLVAPLQRARTLCASFGVHFAMSDRRQSYHSQTSRGSRRNASGVARILSSIRSATSRFRRERSGRRWRPRRPLP